MEEVSPNVFQEGLQDVALDRYSGPSRCPHRVFRGPGLVEEGVEGVVHCVAVAVVAVAVGAG